MRKRNKRGDATKSFSEIKNIEDSSAKFIKSVIEGLDLGSGEFILAVCWVTEDARRYHRLFPSVLGLDVVFGTNAEQRPQMRGTGKTSSNKNLPIVDALLPKQSKWSFNWFVSDALPSLLDNDALQKTTIILTDQDRELMSAIDQALKSRDKLLGKAVRRICKWHKVSGLLVRNVRFNFLIMSNYSKNLTVLCSVAHKVGDALIRNFRFKISSISNYSKNLTDLCSVAQVDRNYLTKVKKYVDSDSDVIFHQWVKEWLYSFPNYVETKQEEEYSLAKLKKYITDARTGRHVSKKLIQFTDDYLKDFIPDLSSLCLRQYLDVYCGSVSENCFQESENAALKRNPSGPKANNKLNTSVDATTTHTQERYQKLQRTAFKDYSRSSVEGISVSSIMSKISKDINSYIAARLDAQWERRNNYLVIEGKNHL